MRRKGAKSEKCVEKEQSNNFKEKCVEKEQFTILYYFYREMRRKGAICLFDVNKKRNASKRSKELKIGFKFSPPNLAKTCTQKTENGHISRVDKPVISKPTTLEPYEAEKIQKRS